MCMVCLHACVCGNLSNAMLEQEQIRENGLFPDVEINTVQFYFMFKEMDVSISKKAACYFFL